MNPARCMSTDQSMPLPPADRQRHSRSAIISDGMGLWRDDMGVGRVRTGLPHLTGVPVPVTVLARGGGVVLFPYPRFFLAAVRFFQSSR
jgi:hypothetical protein